MPDLSRQREQAGDIPAYALRSNRCLNKSYRPTSWHLHVNPSGMGNLADDRGVTLTGIGGSVGGDFVDGLGACFDRRAGDALD